MRLFNVSEDAVISPDILGQQEEKGEEFASSRLQA